MDNQTTVSDLINATDLRISNVNPPAPSLLISTSRNMNYDHRKYKNIGPVSKSPNQFDLIGETTATIDAAMTNTNANDAAAAETMNDLIDSFEARMLQEMKAEMEADKMLNHHALQKQDGSGRKRVARISTTSGVDSSNHHTSTTTNESTIDALNYRRADDNHDNEGDDFRNGADLSPSNNHLRPSSSGLQSPCSDEHDHHTTSEKYNFDAMTSSIEDTTTSLSKKTVCIIFTS